jgi:hypothetical protein
MIKVTSESARQVFCTFWFINLKHELLWSTITVYA